MTLFLDEMQLLLFQHLARYSVAAEGEEEEGAPRTSPLHRYYRPVPVEPLTLPAGDAEENFSPPER